MTRTARLTIPGSFYQVVSYLRDGRLLTRDDRDRFLTLLGRALERSDWRCFGYRLSSNRLCFAMIAGQQSMDSWARRAHGTFARWFNRRHGERGPVFADRPSTLEVSNQRVASLLADMHDLAQIGNAAWSSRSAYLGLSSGPEWLDMRRDLAVECTDDGPSVDSCDERLEPSLRAFAKRVGGNELELRRSVAVTSRVSPEVERSAHTFLVPALLFATSERCVLPVGVLQRRYAKGAVAKAKRIAIHAAIEFGVSIARVSAALSITRQRGSVIAQLTVDADEASMVREVVAAVRESCQLHSVPVVLSRVAV